MILSPAPIRALVVMGVSGVGKSTVAERLGAALGWRVEDADDHHPAANVAKMARGEALSDADRAPWLARLRALLVERLAADEPTVLACSALRRTYRRTLAGCAGNDTCDPALLFVFLDAPRERVAARLRGRRGHFFDAALLASQFAALEPPAPGERPAALRVDATLPPERIVAEIRRALIDRR